MPNQAGEDAPESAAAPAEVAGDQAAAEATAKPKSRGKTWALKTGQAEAAPKPGKPSVLDAGAKVLAKEARAMTCGAMVASLATKGEWTSLGGKTPAASLYSDILRETRTKGTESCFTKAERGKFGLAFPCKATARPTRHHGGPPVRHPLVELGRPGPLRRVVGESCANRRHLRRCRWMDSTSALGGLRLPSPASATRIRGRALCDYGIPSFCGEENGSEAAARYPSPSRKVINS